MLIECSCGKRLQVKDEFAGKKIRCPACKEIVVAEPVAEEPTEEGIVPEPRAEAAHRRSGKRSRSDEDTDRDAAAEDDDEVAKAPKKPRKVVPAWRMFVGSAVMVVLLGVMGFLFWRAFFVQPGTVELTITEPGATVTIDGKVHHVEADVALELSAGSHEIKVSKEGFQPFMTTVKVKAGESVHVLARLERLKH